MLTLPDLPYAASALDPHISERTLEFHHGKHHATYVTNANNMIKDKLELVGTMGNVNHLHTWW